MSVTAGTWPNRLVEVAAAATKLGLPWTARTLEFYSEQLFAGVPLAGRDVLDIGGGDGLFSFAAVARGAASALCLEPLDDGSDQAAHRVFRDLQQVLGMETVRLESTTLQAFDPGARRFDVFLLHDSVNHLDQNATCELHRSAEARATYAGLFRMIAGMARPEADLVVSDCSRRNCYGDLGLTNPFAPMIRWDCHQPPELWRGVIAKAGFGDARIGWSAVNRLGRAGRLVTGNRVAAYFLKSHFRLRARLAAGPEGS